MHLIGLSRELKIDDPQMLFDEGVLAAQHRGINDILRRARLSADGGSLAVIAVGGY